MMARHRFPTCAVPLIFACLWAADAPEAHAGKFNRVLSVGDQAPSWNDLEGTDGRRHSLADLAQARLVVLVFTSHRCPVARGYDQRLAELHAAFAEAEVQFAAIECGGSAPDTLEKMRRRATEVRFGFPYVHDPAAAISRAYGATCTPTVFVLKPQPDEASGQPRFTVVYQGAIDDSPADAARVRKPYLRQAIEALLAGREPGTRETRPTGCAIAGSED